MTEELKCDFSSFLFQLLNVLLCMYISYCLRSVMFRVVVEEGRHRSEENGTN